MDIFILDEQLRRVEIIDEYESFIWTERYASYGDFELVVASTRGNRALLPVGTRLAIARSYHVMVVETIENDVSTEGVATLKVTGRSLEYILEDRPAFRLDLLAAGQPANVEWNYAAAPPMVLAKNVFDSVCRGNPYTPNDNIPSLVTGTLLPPGTIPYPSEVVLMTFQLETVYSCLTKLCTTYGMGFRLIREERGVLPGRLYFEIYMGDDRTTLQTANQVVVFSPELENLSDTKELTSTAKFKNVAYVLAKNGSMIVYADGVENTISGFDRRVMVVDASNIELPAGAELTAAMLQRGKEELANNRPVIAFDAEIPEYGGYIYGQHYDLGDLVEMRNADSVSTNMVVTEQIFVSDREGERSYPTLSIDLLITPGSWLAWNTGEVWDDAEGNWADV